MRECNFAREIRYRERSEDSATLGDLFFYLKKLTLPDRGPIRRFAFVMVGFFGPEADATLFTVQTLRMGKNDNRTYLRVFTYVFTCIYVRIYMYLRTYLRVFMYVFMCIYIRIYVRFTHVFTCIYVRIYLYLCSVVV